MNAALESTLQHLRALVAFDTRNPPRAIDTGGIFDHLHAHLAGFDCTLSDHGAGAVSFFATRGRPKLLFNVHLDTVPDAPGWSASPFDLRVADERAIGLGACDIKGAAAALLTAANLSTGDAALLFTTDEEANDARCVDAFLQTRRPHARTQPRQPLAAALAAGDARATQPGVADFDTVIVAEPTRGEAVLAHRGIQSVQLSFRGCAGHAALDQALADSAVHQALRWGANALDFAASQAQQSFGEMTGLRLNVGRIEGGIKANMIAAQAQVRCGLRPLPSMDADALLAQLCACAPVAPVECIETFRGAALPAGAAGDAESRRIAARERALALGLPIGKAVDFWTEAALFSQAGYHAIVYGPGDIAQAHSADEWVALEQLDTVTRTYLDILGTHA